MRSRQGTSCHALIEHFRSGSPAMKCISSAIKLDSDVLSLCHINGSAISRANGLRRETGGAGAQRQSLHSLHGPAAARDPAIPRPRDSYESRAQR